MLWRSALRADFAQMLGPGSRRKTRYVRCAHCAQTDATDQSTKRAARAAARSALRGASQARHSLPERSFASQRRTSNRHNRASRQAVPSAGDFWGDEEHRPGVGAHSAIRHQARRICLSEVSAANAASYATQPRVEHHSAVDAQRRPPQHEPALGIACRDAPQRDTATHPNRNATTPPTTTAVPNARCNPNFSFSNHVPSNAANSTEVSRSAATLATGACVMAHSAMA